MHLCLDRASLLSSVVLDFKTVCKVGRSLVGCSPDRRRSFIYTQEVTLKTAQIAVSPNDRSESRPVGLRRCKDQESPNDTPPAGTNASTGRIRYPR